MYCTTAGSHAEVYEDNGRMVRRIIVNGSVENAYMSGNDKVAITYSNGNVRYTELWDISGRMIRRTACR